MKLSLSLAEIELEEQAERLYLMAAQLIYRNASAVTKPIITPEAVSQIMLSMAVLKLETTVKANQSRTHDTR